MSCTTSVSMTELVTVKRNGRIPLVQLVARRLDSRQRRCLRGDLQGLDEVQDVAGSIVRGRPA